MKFNHVTLNMPVIQNIEKAIQQSLVETAEAVREDVQQSQTMPYEIKSYGPNSKRKSSSGHLQNKATFVDESKLYKNEVRIVSDTPYARRLYFHPEYNFYKGENPNAGGRWFDPYINGQKKDYVKKLFEEYLRSFSK